MNESGQLAEQAATETIRCIFCQTTVKWPMTEAYPSRCLHCGRASAYAAERVHPPEGSAR